MFGGAAARLVSDGTSVKRNDRLTQAESFVGSEEETAIALNGSADRAAKLAKPVTGLREGAAVGEPVVGVECFVIEKVERRAMKFVGPTLADDRNLAAGISSVLG